MGDVAVEPGDWVVGDVDGVVVLPGARGWTRGSSRPGVPGMAKEAAVYSSTLRGGGSTVEEFGLDTTLVEGCVTQ